MRKLSLGLAAALAACAPAAQALELAPICSALHRLGEEARTTGQPQRISLVKANAASPMACEPGARTSAQAAFCEAATEAIGAEFHHLYPWRLYDCLRTLAADPRVTTADEFTGVPRRQKLTRLEARLGGGVWMESVWAPGPDADQGANRGYYGRYDLVVWRPGR
jgi:hypothetical protein